MRATRATAACITWLAATIAQAQQPGSEEDMNLKARAGICQAIMTKGVMVLAMTNSKTSTERLAHMMAVQHLYMTAAINLGVDDRGLQALHALVRHAEGNDLEERFESCWTDGISALAEMSVADQLHHKAKGRDLLDRMLQAAHQAVRIRNNREALLQ